MERAVADSSYDGIRATDPSDGPDERDEPGQSAESAGHGNPLWLRLTNLTISRTAVGQAGDRSDVAGGVPDPGPDELPAQTPCPAVVNSRQDGETAWPIVVEGPDLELGR